MKGRFEKYLKTGLEYSPIVLTILFSIYVGLLNQFKPLTDSQLLEWILIILSLLAASILVDRFSRLNVIENHTRETNLILSQTNKTISLDSILSTRKKLPPLEDRLSNAREIAIFGGSLLRLTNEYLSYFEAKAQLRCKMKFLLLDPNCLAVKIVAESIVYEVNDFNDYKNHIQTSLGNLIKLKTKYPDCIEIKIHDIVPTYSMLGLKAEKDDQSEVMVEFYTYLTPTRERPHLLVKKAKDPNWFKYFNDQFELIWSKSKVI